MEEENSVFQFVRLITCVSMPLVIPLLNGFTWANFWGGVVLMLVLLYVHVLMCIWEG